MLLMIWAVYRAQAKPDDTFSFIFAWAAFSTHSKEQPIVYGVVQFVNSSLTVLVGNQFSAILLLKIAQNGGKFKFQYAISFDWIDIFQNCFHF